MNKIFLFFLVVNGLLTALITVGVMVTVRPVSVAYRKRIVSQYALYLIVFAVFVTPPAVPAVFLAIVISLANYEFFTAIAQRRRIHVGSVRILVCTLFGIVAPLYCLFFPDGYWSLSVVAVTLILAMFIMIRIHAALTRVHIIATSLAFSASIASFVLIRQAPQGVEYALFIFLLISFSDTFAMFFGKILGKRRLTMVSPGKTVEGAGMSLCATIGVCFMFNAVLALGLAPFMTVVVAVVVNTTALVGDLIFSSIKRRLEIKDFGAMIPGHGGILDRLDSCLISVPLFLILMKVCGR